MGLLRKWRAAARLLALATVIHAVRSSESHGAFMGVPFDFRSPTPAESESGAGTRKTGGSSHPMSLESAGHSTCTGCSDGVVTIAPLKQGMNSHLQESASTRNASGRLHCPVV